MNPPVAVCIIVENLPVPLDRRVWQESLALRDAGYRVAVICPKGPGFNASHETLDGIEVHRYRIWDAATPFGYLAEYAWALAAQFLLALRVYARLRFRVLEACNPPDTIFLIGCFLKLFGVRFIFDHHDLNPELFEAKFGKRGVFYRLVCLAERLTFRTADAAIATNESYREVAITRGGVAPERAFIVRSTPDLAKVRRDPPQPGLKEGRKYLVLYVGVMAPQDGVDLLLQSIAAIATGAVRGGPDPREIQFVLVGRGSETERLREMASRMGLGDSVKFTGRLPDEEMFAYLRTADVGVAPDPVIPMNDKSTMNKVLEYMAYGLPVVMYPLTEGRRSAGDAALYAQPNDPEDFARKILELLGSEALRRELGARGRARIEQGLNWEKEKESLLAAYRAALGGKG